MTPAAAESSPFQRGMIAISVMLATVLQVLDTTIATVALPHMQGSMSATQDQISWVLTSYLIAAAIATPLTGVLAARFGRKRLFLAAVLGFTVTSMLCGIATSLPEMVIFRLLQGAFGAALVPLSQSVLLDTYPREQHGSAMAIWGVGIMVGPILGPTLGGYLTEVYNWRWVFYVNLPFGILAMLGIMTFVSETDRDRTRGFDFYGFALLSLAVGAFQLALDRGQSKDWFSSSEIVLEMALAAVFFYTFIVHIFTHKKPFVDPALFKDRNFTTGLFFIFMVSMIMLSTMALLPPFLQNLKGYPVLTTGYILAPRGIGTMIAMVLVGRLINTTDSRLLILAGIGLTSFSLWQMSNFNVYVPISDIVWTGVVQGFGLGFIFVPLSTVTFSTLAPERRTDGASIFSLVRNIGAGIGVSVMVTLLAQSTQISHAGIVENLSPFRIPLQPPFLPQAWNWHFPSGVIALNGEATRQAATIAYLNDFTVMMWVTLLAAPLILLLKKTRS